MVLTAEHCWIRDKANIASRKRSINLLISAVSRLPGVNYSICLHSVY
jgi:hypothetical protein